MIKIANFRITEKSPSFIIGEIGSNHQQDLVLAKESIATLSDIGANAVKFQSINLNELYHEPNLNTKNLHKIIDLNEKWHHELKSYADKNNVIFLSSPTYLKSVDILKKINVDCFKIASAQTSVFPQLVKKVASLNKPTFVSTGMTRDNEIDKIIKIFKNYNNKKYIIMYCNSIYPTPPEIVFIKRLINIKSLSPILGFSDHTLSNTAALSALSLGAKVFEKHFKINNKIKSPDSHFSLNPSKFKNYIDTIREFEKIYRYKNKNNLEKDEKKFRESISYFLFPQKNFKAGYILKDSDIKFLRNESYDKKIFLTANDCFDKKIVLSNDSKTGVPIKRKDVKLLDT